MHKTAAQLVGKSYKFCANLGGYTEVAKKVRGAFKVHLLILKNYKSWICIALFISFCHTLSQY